MNLQDLAKAAEPDNDEKNGERGVCGSGWRERWDKSNRTPFFCDIPPGLSPEPSILDDNSTPICIPKMLPELCLPSTSKRLENIDIYWQNTEAWQNSIWDIAPSIFPPFSILTGTRYWLHIKDLIVLLRQSWGTAWFVGCIIIVPSCQFSNDTHFH